MVTTEQWKPVPGFPSYAVSSHGRIKRLVDCHRARAETFVQSHSFRGYRRVLLYNQSFRRLVLVHRLVLHAFFRSPRANEQGNHKNGIKHDNQIRNLEWTTQAQNMRHAHRTGLFAHAGLWRTQHPERLPWGDRNGSRTHPERRPRGDSHWSHQRPERVLRGAQNGRAKLSDADVRYIRRASYRYGVITALARKFGVNRQIIHRIRNRILWKHLP